MAGIRISVLTVEKRGRAGLPTYCELRGRACVRPPMRIPVLETWPPTILVKHHRKP